MKHNFDEPTMQAAIDAARLKTNDDPSGKSTSVETTTPEWTPKVGDVVTLKSGGPKMTVNKSAAADENALCNYFDNDGRLHASYFPSATLQPA